MKKICVYPGSFDPFTLGHLDVLLNAADLFDRVYVGVLNNSSKNALFNPEERVEMIQRVIEQENLQNVQTDWFDGLLVDYARSIGASHIIRGLRAITDFEYEFQIDAINRHLDSTIRTLYFMADPAHSFLSSSNVKEIGALGGCIDALVPQCNIGLITKRLGRKKN